MEASHKPAPILSEVLEALGDAVVGVDGACRVALMNGRAERLFGYEGGELLGHPVELLLRGPLHSLLPTGGRQGPIGEGLELAGRRKDGTEFAAELSLSEIGTDQGPMVLATIRNASARRPPAELQAGLAAIVQSSHDAIVGKTLDGVITSWNPGAEALYGFSASEVVGQPIDVLVPAERRADELDQLHRIARGERIEPYQTERLRWDGTTVTVSSTMSPITDEGGAIIGVASVSRDIDERGEAKFRGLLEAAPDAMLCVDASGTITLVNAQVERLFGYHRDELVGEPVELLVPEAARAVHPRRREGYVADPHPRPMGAGMELAGRRRDGSEFPAEISLSALQTDDGLLFTATVRDVTERLEAQAERERLKAQAERERMESQLHQSQRLESLGQLAGGVAHDFNNMLAVILNYTAFVGQEIAAASKEESGDRWITVADDLQQITRAAQRAIALTHQLLAFGRREVVRPQALVLNDVVSDVEQLLRRSIGEDVELATSLRPDLWTVMADPGQIEQVLVNLAVNARGAMPTGGRLTIDTDNMTIEDDFAGKLPNIVPGRYVRLRVSDTGSGMSPDVVKRAFEPFFTTKPKGEGSGLGLATVYGIITQAGGHAFIYSEPGLGTTLSAFLPATTLVATTPVEGAAQPEHRRGGGETILLTEDEEALREVARRILSRNGYRVITAGSGAEALAAASQYEGEIHLLLTDVIMPKMLGRDLARRLSELRPNMRVLYMSGYAQPVLASKGTLDDGVTLLEKPFSEPMLLALVRQVVD